MLVCGCLQIPNLPPAALILADGLEGQPPFRVQFDGTSSIDEDGIVCAYFWSFDDSATSDSMRPTHVYALPGEYAVTLQVTDDDGDTSSTTVTVVVTEPNLAPIPVFTTAPSAVVPGETVRFNASASHDEDGWIESYQWDLGDGTTAQGEAIEHQYSVPGTCHVTLTVTDNAGATATVQSEMLVVSTNIAPQPQLEVSAAVLAPGEPLICSADGSIDPDGEIVTYEWNFGDGSHANGTSATHVYAAEGTYRVTLTTTDNEGARQSTNCIVTVGIPTNPAPPPSDPTDMIIRSFRWSFGGITRSLSLSIPEPLIASYQSLSRGVWADDGYARFVLDPSDDALMTELRDRLMLNSSYQATIENALAFVQKAVEYQLDPIGIEYPRYPAETLVDGVGDCEDSAILYASIVRTFEYSAGVLLASVDTNGDQVSDHVIVFVRVADCFTDAHPERSLWEISGRTYALAETAVSGGYLALGVDPWGIKQEDIHNIWDVANPTLSLRATRQFP